VTRWLCTAWRACPLGLAFCASASAAWLLLAAVTGWNLADRQFVAAGVGAAALVIVLLQAGPIFRFWTRSPIALRAELRGALKAMKISEGLWVTGEDVLLSPGFGRWEWMLMVMPAQEFWAAQEYGGVYTITAFLLPVSRPKVYRHTDGARVDPAHPGEILEPPGTRRQRARALGRAAAQGRMDATPEEIRTVLRQMKGAVPIPDTEPPRDTRP
jgi:hypothetical protein